LISGIDLLKKLLEISHFSRFSAEEALSHSWFFSSPKSKAIFFEPNFFHFKHNLRKISFNKIPENEIDSNEKLIYFTDNDQNYEFIKKKKKNSLKQKSFEEIP